MHLQCGATKDSLVGEHNSNKYGLLYSWLYLIKPINPR